MEGEVRVTPELRWDQGILLLEIAAPLGESETPPPLVKYAAEQQIRRDFSRYLDQALETLTIDSFRTFADALNQAPDLLPVLDTLAAAAVLKKTQLSRDMKTLLMDFQVPLYPHLIRSFLSPGNSLRLPPALSWEPSADFTGLVIYAADPLPVHGEKDARGMVRTALVEPCLLPKLFDQDMNLILSPELMDRDSLLLWGAAEYTSGTDAGELSRRVGNYPFYTTAQGIFGKNRTDLLLPREDVRRLLSREPNRRLLREGRIVIITSPPPRD